MITALIIFVITYLFIGLRQIPRLHVDRPAGALVGAVLMIVFGVLSLEVRAAYGAEGAIMGNRPGPKIVTITPSDPAASRVLRVVLLCDTVSSRAKGLQGFRPLKRDEAALFVFEKPEAVVFWMGSVVYPIDIVFVGPDNKVVKVYPNRKPGSTEYYPSVVPVRWVIETAAGSGIRAGDRVMIK